MKKKWRIVPAVILALFGLLLWEECAFWPISSICGITAAAWDTSHGRYEVIVYGMPPAWRHEQQLALLHRHGIRLDARLGCIVPPWARSFAVAYDGVSEERIRRKLGSNVVRETAEEAAENWLRAHADDFK